MLLTRIGLALVVTSLAVRGGSAGAAEPAALQLEWSAPGGCPQAAEVRALTAGVLGREIAEDGSAATRVRARVRTTRGGFRLTIETRSASGNDVRKLEDRRCAVLAEAAAVIAAAAIDETVRGGAAGTGVGDVAGGTGDVVGGTGAGDVAEGTGDVVEGTGAGDVAGGTGEVAGGTGVPTLVPVMPVVDPATRGGVRAAEGPRAPVVTPELEPLEAGPVERVAPAAARRLRFGVRVAGVFDVGGTPGPTGGLMLAGALIGRRWRVEALGLWLAPRTTRPDPALPLEARVGLLAAGLRGCGVPGRGVIEVPLCGGVEAGALRGAGSGAALAEPGTDALPWLAVTAGPGLVWSPVPRVGLGLTLDVVVPLLPRRFAVAGFGDVYSPAAPVAGRALASLELRFR